MWGKAAEYAAEQKCEEQRTSQMEKKSIENLTKTETSS